MHIHCGASMNGLSGNPACRAHLAAGAPLGAGRGAVHGALAVADAVLRPLAHERGAPQRLGEALQVALLQA